MDLRKPSGMFFTLLGFIVAATGLVNPSARAPLTDLNVNLYAGAGMLIFGGLLLWLAHRASR